MEVYILKSVACLGILFGFYKLVLENTSLHTTKRIFLLGSLLVSMLIPCITFTEYVEVAPISTENFIPISDVELTTATEAAIQTNYLPYLLGGLYGIGLVVFSVRFGRNMWRILKNARQNPTIKKTSILYVLLNLPVTPHSFFNYIFFNKNSYKAGDIPSEVIAHETAHVLQKHSWDIVAFELIRIVFWFNPLFYFIKKSIKLNHEFMADRAVLNQGADPIKYQNIVLDFSSGSHVQTLAHSINYSSIKKRFTVMTTHTSKRAAWFKGLLVLPLLAILIFGFSEKKEEFVSLTNADSNMITSNVFDLSVIGENKILHGKSEIQLTDFEALVQKENYTTATVNVSSNANVGFAKNVVTELVRLDLANNMSICTSSVGDGNVLSKEDIDEIMSPLFNRYKNSNTTTTNLLGDAVSKGKQIKEKTLLIMVQMSKITINGKPSSLKTFARDLDAVTKSWEETDYTDTRPIIKIASTPTDFLKKLDAEYKKTHFSKANGGLGLLPPPPPPSAPSPANVSDAPKTNVVQYHSKDGKVKTTTVPNVPPPPPPPAPEAPKVLKEVNDGDPNLPPPPPPPSPKSPREHIMEMQKKGAIFYYDGKKVSGETAVDLLKRNEQLNVETTGANSKNPVVKITTKPIGVNSN